MSTNTLIVPTRAVKLSVQVFLRTTSLLDLHDTMCFCNIECKQKLLFSRKHQRVPLKETYYAQFQILDVILGNY